MKTFCIECRNLQLVGEGQFMCNAEENCIDWWLSPKGDRKESPSELNKDNNCDWFHLKEDKNESV